MHLGRARASAVRACVRVPIFLEEIVKKELAAAGIALGLSLGHGSSTNNSRAPCGVHSSNTYGYKETRCLCQIIIEIIRAASG